MSILCVARWRSARGKIEWICTQERWNTEVAIIFGAAARYRRATVGSSNDGAHPDVSALQTGAVRPHTGFVESLFFMSPRMGHGSVNVWLQSRSLPARGRVGLEVHRCLCIIDSENVFISTAMG
jgi:hypothetical protein